MSQSPGNFTLENAQPGKPSRQELLERLKMAKMRGGGIHRMPKKQREEKLEQLKTVLGEQQKKVVENLRGQLTPDQLRQMGIPVDTDPNQVHFQSVDEATQQKLDSAPDVSQATEENPVNISFSIPKMSKVNTDEKTHEI